MEPLAWRAQRLRIDAGTVEMFAAFEAAGVGAVLLKGRTVAEWLYGEHELRPQGDCDVLVDPSKLEAAEQVLESLGYGRYFDGRHMPAWWRQHPADAWWRASDGVTIDIHRALPGAEVDAGIGWRLLAESRTHLPIAGREVPALAVPARALHVALHAAQHGVEAGAPLEDLRRALAVEDDELWKTAAALACELHALHAFVAGLRLDPAGAALAERLRLPSAVSVAASLRASSSSHVALGFEQIAQARGLRRRVVMLTRKVVPPADYIRHWDPRAAGSLGALLRAYLRRQRLLAGQAPGALCAWYRARRAARLGRSE